MYNKFNFEFKTRNRDADLSFRRTYESKISVGASENFNDSCYHLQSGFPNNEGNMVMTESSQNGSWTRKRINGRRDRAANEKVLECDFNPSHGNRNLYDQTFVNEGNQQKFAVTLKKLHEDNVFAPNRIKYKLVKIPHGTLESKPFKHMDENLRRTDVERDMEKLLTDSSFCDEHFIPKLDSETDRISQRHISMSRSGQILKKSRFVNPKTKEINFGNLPQSLCENKKFYKLWSKDLRNGLSREITRTPNCFNLDNESNSRHRKYDILKIDHINLPDISISTDNHKHGLKKYPSSAMRLDKTSDIFKQDIFEAKHDLESSKAVKKPADPYRNISTNDGIMESSRMYYNTIDHRKYPKTDFNSSCIQVKKGKKQNMKLPALIPTQIDAITPNITFHGTRPQVLGSSLKSEMKKLAKEFCDVTPRRQVSRNYYQNDTKVTQTNGRFSEKSTIPSFKQNAGRYKDCKKVKEPNINKEREDNFNSASDAYFIEKNRGLRQTNEETEENSNKSETNWLNSNDFWVRSRNRMNSLCNTDVNSKINSKNESLRLNLSSKNFEHEQNENKHKFIDWFRELEKNSSQRKTSVDENSREKGTRKRQKEIVKDRNTECNFLGYTISKEDSLAGERQLSSYSIDDFKDQLNKIPKLFSRCDITEKFICEESPSGENLEKYTQIKAQNEPDSFLTNKQTQVSYSTPRKPSNLYFRFGDAHVNEVFSKDSTCQPPKKSRKRFAKEEDFKSLGQLKNAEMENAILSEASLRTITNRKRENVSCNTKGTQYEVETRDCIKSSNECLTESTDKFCQKQIIKKCEDKYPSWRDHDTDIKRKESCDNQSCFSSKEKSSDYQSEQAQVKRAEHFVPDGQSCSKSHKADVDPTLSYEKNCQDENTKHSTPKTEHQFEKMESTHSNFVKENGGKVNQTDEEETLSDKLRRWDENFVRGGNSALSFSSSKEKLKKFNSGSTMAEMLYGGSDESFGLQENRRTGRRKKPTPSSYNSFVPNKEQATYPNNFQKPFSQFQGNIQASPQHFFSPVPNFNSPIPNCVLENIKVLAVGQSPCMLNPIDIPKEAVNASVQTPYYNVGTVSPNYPLFIGYVNPIQFMSPSNFASPDCYSPHKPHYQSAGIDNNGKVSNSDGSIKEQQVTMIPNEQAPGQMFLLSPQNVLSNPEMKLVSNQFLNLNPPTVAFGLQNPPMAADELKDKNLQVLGQEGQEKGVDTPTTTLVMNSNIRTESESKPRDLSRAIRIKSTCGKDMASVMYGDTWADNPPIFRDLSDGKSGMVKGYSPLRLEHPTRRRGGADNEKGDFIKSPSMSKEWTRKSKGIVPGLKSFN